MDSFTLLHHALDQEYHVDCITFDYGQRHIKEIECARLICKENNLKNLQIEIANVESIFAKSALTSNEIDSLLPFYKSDHVYKTKKISGSCINQNKKWLNYITGDWRIKLKTSLENGIQYSFPFH